MLLGAALRAGTGLQGWGAENATLHRRLQLGKGAAPSPDLFPASGGAMREVCTMGASRGLDIALATPG
jgi:hypothetical protein